jgi:hypothetical protein
VIGAVPQRRSAPPHRSSQRHRLDAMQQQDARSESFRQPGPYLPVIPRRDADDHESSSDPQEIECVTFHGSLIVVPIRNGAIGFAPHSRPNVVRREDQCRAAPSIPLAGFADPADSAGRRRMGSSVVLRTTNQVAGRNSCRTETPSPTCIISRIAKASARTKVLPAGTRGWIAQFGTCGTRDALGRSPPTGISWVSFPWSATPFFRPDLSEWA